MIKGWEASLSEYQLNLIAFNVEILNLHECSSESKICGKSCTITYAINDELKKLKWVKNILKSNIQLHLNVVLL